MKKSRKREWFDNDDFWRDTYAFMFTKARLDGTAEEVKQVLKLVGTKGKDVLDLCCGPGRFAINLAQRKYNVTGVDRTTFLLNKAKAAARRNKVKIEWVTRDMRDFVRPDSFDLALCMYTSLGFFDNEREDLLVIRNMFESLRSGGVCVLDLLGKERLARIFHPTVSSELPDGRTLLQRHKVIDDWTRIRNEWILVKNGRATSYKFDLRIYSGLEIRERMENIGFSGVKLYGSFAGDPYDLNAQRLIVVGRKR